jgi:type VI secretion system secreted protein Hcp
VAESWFLKIDGIEGGSTSLLHEGEIDIESWSWGITATSPGGGGGGGGAGRANFQDFHFVARISKASPRLFLSAATGVHHKFAALTGVRGSGKKQNEFLKYKLSDVTVTSLQQSDDPAVAPTEQFSLSYSKFEITFTPISSKGTPEPPIQAGFDVQANKKF